jgi:hypothetical protein
LGAAAACWTHPLGLVVAIGVIVGLAATDRHRLTLAGSVILAVAAIPVVWRIFSVSTGSEVLSLGLGWQRTLDIFWAIGNLYHAVWLGPVLITGAAVAGLVLLERHSRPVALAAGVMLALGLLISIPAAVQRSFGIERYLVVSRVGFHFGLAALAGLLPSTRARWVLTVVLLLLSGRLMLETARFEKPLENRVGLVARAIAPHVAPGEVVYYTPQSLAIVGQYYQVPGGGHLWGRGFFPEPYPYAASWLVVGHGAPGSSVPLRIVERLSTHHGAFFDQLLFNRLYASGRALAARVAPGDVAFMTTQGTWVRSKVAVPSEPGPE